MRHAASVARPDRDEFAQLLRVMCRRLALELELIRQIGMRLEQSLCNAADAWGIDDERVRDLQQLDHLTQHAAALRDFLSIVSEGEGSTESGLDAALERIKLGDVRARLAGTAQGGDGARAEVEFF